MSADKELFLVAQLDPAEDDPDRDALYDLGVVATAMQLLKLPDGTVRVLVEGVRRGCFSYFNAFPDLHCSLDEFVAEGDKVFLRTTMTGTHDGEYKGIEPTGRHVSAECAEVFRIKDGKFVGYWCMTNVAGLMRQLTEEPAKSLQGASA